VCNEELGGMLLTFRFTVKTIVSLSTRVIYFERFAYTADRNVDLKICALCHIHNTIPGFFFITNDVVNRWRFLKNFSVNTFLCRKIDRIIFTCVSFWWQIVSSWQFFIFHFYPTSNLSKCTATFQSAHEEIYF